VFTVAFTIAHSFSRILNSPLLSTTDLPVIMALIPLVLGVLLLTTSTIANPTAHNIPVTTLPLSRRISKQGIRNVLKNDKSRARRLNGQVNNQVPRSFNDAISQGLVMGDEVLEGYAVDIGIGNPPTTCAHQCVEYGHHV
jgi:hypothetical protein